MPSYDYKCDPCEKLVRVIKSMDVSHEAEKCPHCESWMRRIFMAPHVKGNHTPKFHG